MSVSERDKKSSDDAALEKIRVKIYARAVAAGQSDGKLKVTLLLTPQPVDGDVGFPLSQWPSRVHDTLKSAVGASKEKAFLFPLSFLKAEPDSITKCVPSQTTQIIKKTATCARLVGVFAQAGKNSGIGFATGQWQAAFEAGYGEINNAPDIKAKRWEHLSNALKLSFSGNKFNAGQIKKGAIDNEVSTDPLAEEKKIDGVLSVLQRDLAIGLEIMRARETLATVNGIYAETEPTKTTREAMERDTIKNQLQSAPLVTATPLELSPEELEHERGYTRKVDPVLDEKILKKKKETAVAALRSARESEYKCLKTLGTAGRTIGENAFAEATNVCCSKNVEPTKLPSSSATAATDLAKLSGADLSKTLVGPLASHGYGSFRPEPGKNKAPEDPVESKREKCERQAIERRFFAMQSTPSLARLFLLAVDVEVEMDADLNAIGFLFIGIDWNSMNPDVAKCFMKSDLTTLAQIKPEQPDPYFWPATRDEMNGVKELSQMGGLIVMSEANSVDHRFEITSLDVRNAAEAEYQRNYKRQIDEPDNSGATDDSPETIKRHTITTGGLALLDRGRQSRTAAKLASREHCKNDTTDLFLDADDLTLGFRLDVGIPANPVSRKVGDPDFHWRSLMDRKVDFGTSGDFGPEVRKLLAGLVGDIESPERIQLDSASVSTPIKFIPTEFEETGNVSRDAIVEEHIAVWEGGPMAVDCSGSPEQKEDNDDLPFGRTVSLPGIKDRRPPPLRFGWGYAFGMRAVYMGGASVPVDTASLTYNRDRAFTFPPKSGSTQESVRRFLRHERLDAPSLLLPDYLAFEPDGFMGFERSPHAILRSYVGLDALSNTTTDITEKLTETESKAYYCRSLRPTVRILVPPSVPQAFAALHGAFDRDDRQDPEQGLAGVAINRLEGGFPAVVATEVRGLNGELIQTERHLQLPRDANGNGDAEKESAKQSGDAIFSTNPSILNELANGPNRYYPDPLVESYAIGLRYAGTTKYVLNTAKIVAVRDKKRASDYPQVLPLKISVVQLAEARPKTLFPIEADYFRDLLLPAERFVQSKSGNRIPVQAVELRLAPGEDFEIDIWCIPAEKDMARQLALIETIGMLAIVNGDKNISQIDQFQHGLHQLMPAEPCSAATDCIEKFDKAEKVKSGYFGPGGLPTPGPAGLMAVAAALRTAMLRRPVDEIASVRSFRATHAINRPLHVPKFGVDGNENGIETRALRIARPSREILAEISSSPNKSVSSAKSNYRFAKYFSNSDDKERPVVVNDAHDFAFGGSVLIDLDTSDGFEIRASTVFPRTTLFDDPDRRRSRLQRRTGEWPIQMILTSDALNGPEKKKTWVPTASIYGFHVYPDGRVELPLINVTLLRAENLKSPQVTGQGAAVGELESIDLEKLYGIGKGGKFYIGANGENPGTTVPIEDQLIGTKFSVPHAFPDGKARHLKLTIVSTSRFATLMRKPARIDKNRKFYPNEPLPDETQSLSSAKHECWLPATVRPSKPQTRSPLPVFNWAPLEKTGDGDRATYKCSRRSTIRIPMKRGWFSSGEGERLGVVLWPPNLFDKGVLDHDPIIEVQDGTNGLRKIDLTDFQDSDLGPGGAFVTRWGGDPIRQSNKGLIGNFIPIAQFADFGTRLTKPVLMPIPVQNGKGSPETLTVSLLTFEPHFDVDREEWFVDVDITPASESDPFVRLGLVRYQEHAPPHLQVSEPVVEWTQLLPGREIKVDVQYSGSLDVLVTVEGLSSIGQRQGRPLPAKGFDDNFDYPVMQMELCVEYHDEHDVLQREVLDFHQVSHPFSAEEEKRMRPDDRIRATAIRRADDRPEGISFNGAKTVWNHLFKAISAPTHEKMKSASLFVYVQEVDMRPKATFDHEPLPVVGTRRLNDEQYYRESGPRFAVRVDIPFESVLKPTSQLRDGG